MSLYIYIELRFDVIVVSQELCDLVSLYFCVVQGI